MGVYQPKKTPTSIDRDNFRYMARKLKDEQIQYTVAEQVMYNDTTAGSWVDPWEVAAMRCDGVVEYVYEWYGFRVFGNDTYWDVTRTSRMGRDLHAGIGITPKKQAQSYLYKVSSSLP
jgi:hypothetical protein